MHCILNSFAVCENIEIPLFEGNEYINFSFENGTIIAQWNLVQTASWLDTRVWGCIRIRFGLVGFIFVSWGFCLV